MGKLLSSRERQYRDYKIVSCRVVTIIAKSTFATKPEGLIQNRIEASYGVHLKHGRPKVSAVFFRLPTIDRTARAGRAAQVAF